MRSHAIGNGHSVMRPPRQQQSRLHSLNGIFGTHTHSAGECGARLTAWSNSFSFPTGLRTPGGKPTESWWFPSRCAGSAQRYHSSISSVRFHCPENRTL